MNNAYQSKVNKWICMCPTFAVSHFLVCRHLIHCVHHVPPLFFLKAECFCEPPFWRHKSLKLFEEYCDKPVAVIVGPVEGSCQNPDIRGEGNEDNVEGTDFSDKDDNEGDIGTYQHNGSTFKKAMTANIDLILDMAAGLKHQLQFQDQQLLNAL
ncbi:hypothetical protein BJV74DRAFT_731331, partial [Russula compacta]